MTSILTNNGAMVALQTLKSINSDLAATQNQISTGKDVATAKDNSAVWAISKVMESDVSGFKAISDSLSLGESTVAVGRAAAETTTDLLTEIKAKITASQEENVDRGKIKADISALTDQIEAVVGSAQFNGLNLINGSADSPVKVMASLDRDSNGGVTKRTIDVKAQDLSQTAATAGGLTGADPTVILPADTAMPPLWGAGEVVAGSTATVATFTSATAEVDAGRSFQGQITGMSAAVTYVAKEGDSLSDVNSEMATRLNVQAAKDGLDVSFSVNDAGAIEMTNNTDASITIAAGNFKQALDDGTESNGVAGGSFDLLNGLDVSTDNGAKAALMAIEGLIENSIDAAASFGSVEKRISIQNEFVGKLTDSMTAGIGSLVDADMEETSAKLKALQTQQQLGIQSLSIANQAPGAIMSLFR